MGRLAHGEFSQSSRAIKWRANKAFRNAAIALERQGATELIIGKDVVMPPKPKATKPKEDAIGVFTREPAEIEPEGEQPYHCTNCQATVHQGDQACGVCERRLDWAGI